MHRDLHVDADIKKARTVPSFVYTEPAEYFSQVERVFARSWLVLPFLDCHVPAGHAYPFTLLEGCLNEPLVAVRDEQEQLRVLSNVCTHRGNIVVKKEGPVSALRCSYHGRSFNHQGSVTCAPGFEDLEGFPSEADNLPSVAVRRWGPILFASLHPACAFEEVLAPVRKRTDWLRPERFIANPADSRDYLVDAHWALYCDNYLEGFHIPFVHRGLTASLDCNAYRTETYRWSSVQIGIARDDQVIFHLPSGHPDEGLRIAAWYVWIWPSTMLNFYPWGLSLNVVLPEGPRRTRISYRVFEREGAPARDGAGADLHRVEVEDERVVESCQRGVSSRLYRPGRFAPRHEAGVHHFHRLLAQALTDRE